ncbi:hypothetical protein CHGG_10402 [Chaetomium globosum CBS 148.51]|uniref:Uncharacterized protein n=1 Tax=Chaetomium globosum (strain ATCC 6205 / CBS 148.51 / DSM 1962 / NBRC 6347 / NRRL 1970) TaxID=306901 RepID=Q2GNQ2_CHAGB|nr:uncharacterized protein CHGG_10402 [Chaetomium globosum CBS 148.51]EAQ83998.1 hypothetical protein CHGG_10402 [Chaetomium globosum CBS 148.51]
MSRQKQRTPPLVNPRLAHSQISIPVPNLQTPPPTSPRRKLGLLHQHHHSSSSTSSIPRAITTTSAATTTPRPTATTTTTTNPTISATPASRSSSRASTTNSNPCNPSHSRAGSRADSRADSRAGSALSLRLHTGTGTGVGIGLGAGLPVSPLPAAAAATSSFWRGRARGASRAGGAGGAGGQRFVSGVGTGSEGSGFSPLRPGVGVGVRTGQSQGQSQGQGQGQDEDQGQGDEGGQEGDGDSSSPSRSLSQSWSDLAGEVEGAERGGEEREGEGDGDGDGEAEGEGEGEGGFFEENGSGTASQRHSWDSVATVKEETGRVRFLDYDYADDGGDTHVGEGSDGYKDAQEYGSFQGRDDPRSNEGSCGYAASPERVSSQKYVEPQAYEIRTEGKHDLGQQYREYDTGRYGDEKLGGAGMGVLGKGEDQRDGGDYDREIQLPSKWDRSQGLERIIEETQETETDTLPPGRIMLMERLCDLVQRLSSVRVGGGLEADVLDVLNVKVDEMDDLLVLAEETAEAEATADMEMQAIPEDEEEQLGNEDAPAQATTEDGEEAATEVQPTKQEGGLETESGGETREEPSKSGSGENDEWGSGMSPAMFPVPMLRVGNQDIRDLASPLPWLTSSFKYSELSISPTRSSPELAAATNEALEAAKQAAQAQADMAERVASEANRLNCELAEIVKNLQARKEESDHLHALLIDRTEAAATRVLDLEQEICDLEDDILSGESELRHLRLKLRAVETLWQETARPDTAGGGGDPDLVRSIENWKADWVLVRDRMLDRKKDRRARRLRLHRAGCVINSLEEREQETTTSSLGGLSMSVSLLGLGGGGAKGGSGGGGGIAVAGPRSPRKRA